MIDQLPQTNDVVNSSAWVNHISVVAGVVVTVATALSGVYIKIRSARNDLTKLKEKEIVDQEAAKYKERETYNAKVAELQKLLTDCQAQVRVGTVKDVLLQERIKELKDEVDILRRELDKD